MARVSGPELRAVIGEALHPARRRATALAGVLDGTRPASTDEQRRLAEVASRLASIPTQRSDEMDPQARARLRQRLVAVATVQGIGADTAPDGLNGSAPTRTAVPRHTSHRAHTPRARDDRADDEPSRGSRRRLVGLRGRVVAGVAALAVVAGLAGTAAASTDALPGETLYGVKGTVESARLVLAGSDLDRGHLRLAMAERRLSEVQGLVGANLRGVGQGQRLSPDTTALVKGALADMDESTRTGASLLLRVHEQQGLARPVADLETFARDQRAHLETLLPELPPGVRPEAGASLALLDRLLVRAGEVLGEGPAGGSGPADQCPRPCGVSSGGTPARTANPTPGPTTSAGGTEDSPLPSGTDLDGNVQPDPTSSSGGATGPVGNLLDDLISNDKTTSSPSPGPSGTSSSSDLGGIVGDTLTDTGNTLSDAGDTLSGGGL